MQTLTMGMQQTTASSGLMVHKKDCALTQMTTVSRPGVGVTHQPLQPEAAVCVCHAARQHLGPPHVDKLAPAAQRALLGTPRPMRYLQWGPGHVR